MNDFGRHRYVRIDLYRYIEVLDEKLNLWLFTVTNIIYAILLWSTYYAIAKSFFVDFMEFDSLLKKLITYIWVIAMKEGLPIGRLLMNLYARKFVKSNGGNRVRYFKEVTLYDTRHFLDSGCINRKTRVIVRLVYLIQVLLGIAIVLCLILGDHTHLFAFQVLVNAFIYWFVVFTCNKRICRFMVNDIFGP